MYELIALHIGFYLLQTRSRRILVQIYMSAIRSGNWGALLQWPSLSLLRHPPSGSSLHFSILHLASIVNVLRKKSVCAQSSICFMLYNVLIGFNMIWNELETWVWWRKLLTYQTIQQLLALGGGGDSPFTISSLAIYSSSFLLLFILAYGIATPGGIFMPSIMASL